MTTSGPEARAAQPRLQTTQPNSGGNQMTCAPMIGYCPRTLQEGIGRWTEDPFSVPEYLPRPHYHFGNVSRGPCIDVMKSPVQDLGEAQSSPQLPDIPELLDVVVFARRLR
ncbi:hypothetical protein F511_08564 [Dorcoceras hygrometricum]|uniref:Uncharacterized protein n=1 Tax=Dorcoceras hygrometricum TaxID=472368 RepID=A0A2Z7D4L5_9LAMI|nr:hypothetical protein F511_08564 [Dorcoceras hygrometricum]